MEPKESADAPLYPTDQLLALLVGNVRALHKAVSVLIATHPSPESARTTWQSNFAEHVDAEMASPLFRSHEFQKGFQAAMAQLTMEFEMADAS